MLLIREKKFKKKRNQSLEAVETHLYAETETHVLNKIAYDEPQAAVSILIRAVMFSGRHQLPEFSSASWREELMSWLLGGSEQINFEW